MLRSLFVAVWAFLGVSALAACDPLFTPALFWMWNARLDAKKLVAQLEDMHAHGFRNVCVHPFPREFRTSDLSSEMDPGYLTQGYLDVLRVVANRAAELGMHFYLYDEGGWPSGGAAGRVAASDPEGRFRQVFMGYGLDGKGIFGTWRLPYAGQTPYPSLVEPSMAERFVSIVHEPTARALGENVGQTVRVVFTDEPQRPVSVPGVRLGWASDFAEVFRAKKGYDLVPYVQELLRRADETDDRLARLRIDYNDVMGDLYVERYLKPIADWCHARGLLSGGHFNGEDLPENTALYGHGSLLRSYRAMDVPGVDTIWRQIFPRTEATVGAFWISPPFPRYASSMAHQCGRKYALSESFCIYGDGCSPVEMKWIVDQQLVRGINTFVFGYAAVSNAKRWTLLFEPHLGPVAPTWDMIPHLIKYISGTCACLSCGRPGAETVILYDVRGFWAGGADRESAAWSHYATAKALDRLNVDYDFTDDESIAAAEVTDAGLRIGRMTYRTVVLPSEKWMLPAAKEKLADWARAGGRVVRGNDLSCVPRTLNVVGQGASDLTVLKRVDGDRRIYLLFNESLSARKLSVVFPEGGRIVRHDPVEDTNELLSENGCVELEIGGGETLIAYAGDVPRDVRPKAAVGDSIRLSEGWTIRRTAVHEATSDDLVVRPCSEKPVPAVLGDWRVQLGGAFSGKAVYRTEFNSPSEGRVRLSLGDVRWCASVKMNGRTVGMKFFPPYVFEFSVTEGRNVLEVTVANLLANQLGDEMIRRRLSSHFPPSPNYEPRQGAYDRDNHESGLFGPVSIECLL